MANTSGFFGGGGGLAPIHALAFTASTTYSPPFDCKALVYVVGAGGSGAAAFRPWGNTWGMGATGGGAGGCAVSLVDLKAANTYTLTVGAGAASVAISYNSKVNGATGGNTSFVDSSGDISTMTGNGGGGGVGFKDNESSGPLFAAGATGGAASGGTLANYTGGGSGSVDMTYTGGQGGGITGGGAVGFNGNGYSSGGVTGNTPSGDHGQTGGAGVGGSSGGVIILGATGGGSGIGPSQSVTQAVGADALGISDSFNPSSPVSLMGNGGSVDEGGTAGPGAGGGAGYNQDVSQQGGAFAGGGGLGRKNPPSNIESIAGSGGLGAGGGGSGRSASSVGSFARSGSGGGGVIIIQILEIS